MSLNKQLSKEVRFTYSIFQTAGQQAGNYPVLVNGSDEHIVIAGGAIRDLYFNRQSRDVDIYYNTTAISAAKFANSLKNLDIDKMARENGFSSVVVTRLSDNTKMGRSGNAKAEDEEDWGDVSDDAKIALEAFADRYVYYINNGVPSHQAVLNAHRQVTSVAAIMNRVPRATSYVAHIVNILQRTGQSSSAGGNKMGKAHPLKSVESFTILFDDRISIEVELMGVENQPVNYIMSHFAVKLSRAYYDGHGVHFTSEFLSDARNKTITVACPIEHARFDRLFSYYLPKMKRYFPDFDVRIDLDAMNGRGGW